MLKYLTTCLASRGDNYAAAGEGEEESKEEESGIETISRESQEIRCRQRKMGEKEEGRTVMQRRNEIFNSVGESWAIKLTPSS